MIATTTGIQTALRVYDNPGDAPQQNIVHQQIGRYNLLWSYYNGSMFDKGARYVNGWINHNVTYPSYGAWGGYIQQNRLYRHIRLIYNPTRRLVDFYPGAIYPGVLSEDGDDLPDGYPIAIPFSDDTDPKLKDAIAQFWQWSNYQALKSVHVRYGAALGSVMLEIVDDADKGKVCAEVVWPGHVVDLQLDPAGNVKSYVIEYKTQDQAAQYANYYTYRKEVDDTSFRYYRDGEPYDYTGDGSVQPNRYGFVPAVWIKHIDVGSVMGSPVISGSMQKIDELNNLASLVHDQINKKVASPMIFWAEGTIQNLINAVKRGNTDEFSDPNGDRENVALIKGPAGGKVESLTSDLNLSDAAGYMDKLIGELEHDHPELAMWNELRGMSQVTGPAAARLVGDVTARVQEAAANYDRGNTALFGMAVAIAGQNLKERRGGWKNPTKQQMKFDGFDLGSYERGDLEISIMPRPLIIPTKKEINEEILPFWQGIQAASTAGVPLAFALKKSGASDDDIDEFQSETDAQKKQEIAQQQAAQAHQLEMAKTQLQGQGNQPQQPGQGNQQPSQLQSGQQQPPNNNRQLASGRG